MCYNFCMEFILAQIFGTIALILVSIGYFFKSKSEFLLAQTLANVFYACAFFVSKAYVGAIIVVISIFRCIYLHLAEKYNFKYKVHFLPIFIILYSITTILFWNSPYDLMPLISSSMFTIGYSITNLQRMRAILIIPNVILVAYNILLTTYASALSIGW